jgi:hypothetical protein
MSATDPIAPVPRRFAIKPLRPRWIGVAAVVIPVDRELADTQDLIE